MTSAEAYAAYIVCYNAFVNTFNSAPEVVLTASARCERAAQLYNDILDAEIAAALAAD